MLVVTKTTVKFCTLYILIELACLGVWELNEPMSYSNLIFKIQLLFEIDKVATVK